MSNSFVLSLQQVSDELYLTAGKLKNKNGKDVNSPELCPKGSWSYSDGTGTWPVDECITVEKEGNINLAYNIQSTSFKNLNISKASPNKIFKCKLFLANWC